MFKRILTKYEFTVDNYEQVRERYGDNNEPKNILLLRKFQGESLIGKPTFLNVGLKQEWRFLSPESQ